MITKSLLELNNAILEKCTEPIFYNGNLILTQILQDLKYIFNLDLVDETGNSFYVNMTSADLSFTLRNVGDNFKTFFERMGGFPVTMLNHLLIGITIYGELQFHYNQELDRITLTKDKLLPAFYFADSEPIIRESDSELTKAYKKMFYKVIFFEISKDDFMHELSHAFWIRY